LTSLGCSSGGYSRTSVYSFFPRNTRLFGVHRRLLNTLCVLMNLCVLSSAVASRGSQVPWRGSQVPWPTKRMRHGYIVSPRWQQTTLHSSAITGPCLVASSMVLTDAITTWHLSDSKSKREERKEFVWKALQHVRYVIVVYAKLESADLDDRQQVSTALNMVFEVFAEA